MRKISLGRGRCVHAAALRREMQRECVESTCDQDSLAYRENATCAQADALADQPWRLDHPLLQEREAFAAAGAYPRAYPRTASPDAHPTVAIRKAERTIDAGNSDQ